MPQPDPFYKTAKWSRTRRQVLHRDGWRCSECGTVMQPGSGEAAVHHVKPLKHAPALGHEPLNLVVVCRTCHTRHENPEPARRKGGCSIDGMPTDPAHPWLTGREGRRKQPAG